MAFEVVNSELGPRNDVYFTVNQWERIDLSSGVKCTSGYYHVINVLAL
jgi:hypothetical protein